MKKNSTETSSFEGAVYIIPMHKKRHNTLDAIFFLEVSLFVAFVCDSLFGGYQIQENEWVGRCILYDLILQDCTVLRWLL